MVVKRKFVEANVTSAGSTAPQRYNKSSNNGPPLIIENSAQFISILEDRADLPMNLPKIENLLTTKEQPVFFINYLLSHPTIPHIEKIIPLVLRGSDLPFMSSLLILLSKAIIFLNNNNQEKDAHCLIRLILSDHMKIIYRALATTSPQTQMSAFSLLEELVGDKATVTSLFCTSFDFGHKCLLNFQKLRKTSLQCLQSFVLKVFSSCSEDEMILFSRNHPHLLHCLLKDLYKEHSLTVSNVLRTITTSIIDLNNRSVSISFFKGPLQPLVEIGKLLLCFGDSNLNDRDLEKKREAASAFLLNACTVNDNGTVPYPLASSGSDCFNLKNRLILDLFLALSQTTEGPTLLLNVKNLLIGPEILQKTFLPILEGSPDVAYHLLLVGTTKQKNGTQFWSPDEPTHIELASSFAIKLFSYLPTPAPSFKTTSFNDEEGDDYPLPIIPVGGVCGLLSRGSLTRGILSEADVLPSLFLLMSLLRRLESFAFSSPPSFKMAFALPDIKTSYNCWKKIRAASVTGMTEEGMMKETILMGVMSSYLRLNLTSPNESLDFLKMDEILSLDVVSSSSSDIDKEIRDALLDAKISLLLELGSPKIRMEMVSSTSLANLFLPSLRGRSIDLLIVILLPLLDNCVSVCECDISFGCSCLLRDSTTTTTKTPEVIKSSKLKEFISRAVDLIGIKAFFEGVVSIFRDRKIFESSNFLVEDLKACHSEHDWDLIWKDAMAIYNNAPIDYGDVAAEERVESVQVKEDPFVAITVESLTWDDGPSALLNSIMPLLPKKNGMILWFMEVIHGWKTEEEDLSVAAVYGEDVTPAEMHNLLFKQCNLGVWLSLIGKAFESGEDFDVRGFIDSMLIGFPFYCLCVGNSSSTLKSHYIMRRLETALLGSTLRRAKRDNASDLSDSSDDDIESDEIPKNRQPIVRERRQIIMILRAFSQQLEPESCLESRLSIIGATLYMSSMAEMLHPGHVAYRAINELFLEKQIPLPIDFANRLMMDVSDGANWRGTLGWFLGLLDSMDPFLMDDDWGLWTLQTPKHTSTTTTTPSKKTLSLEDYLVGLLMSTNHDNGCRRVAKSILEKITKRKTAFIKMDGAWTALGKHYQPRGMVKEV